MVAIKNAVVPPSCYFCPMTNDGFYLCKANNPYEMLEDDCEERRPDWCPLIEIQEPHGRLIDEKDICDKIRPLIENPYCYNRLQVISETLGNCLQIVRDAPTIIPASEEGET